MRCSCVTDPKLSLRAVCWHLRWAEVFRTLWRRSSCRPWDDMQTVKAFSCSISPVTFKTSRDAVSFSCNLYALTYFCSFSLLLWPVLYSYMFAVFSLTTLLLVRLLPWLSHINLFYLFFPFPHFNLLSSILFHLAAFSFCFSFFNFFLYLISFPSLYFFPFLSLFLSFPCFLFCPFLLSHFGKSLFPRRSPSFFSSPSALTQTGRTSCFPACIENKDGYVIA